MFVTLLCVFRAKLLLWDGVPDSEVWIKVGGDKGGGTTKFYFQVVNVAKANSLFNTTCFCVFAADETLPNIHMAMDRFKDQVNSLQDMKWRYFFFSNKLDFCA